MSYSLLLEVRTLFDVNIFLSLTNVRKNYLNIFLGTSVNLLTSFIRNNEDFFWDFHQVFFLFWKNFVNDHLSDGDHQSLPVLDVVVPTTGVPESGSISKISSLIHGVEPILKKLTNGIHKVIWDHLNIKYICFMHGQCWILASIVSSAWIQF